MKMEKVVNFFSYLNSCVDDLDHSRPQTIKDQIVGWLMLGMAAVGVFGTPLLLLFVFP